MRRALLALVLLGGCNPVEPLPTWRQVAELTVLGGGADVVMEPGAVRPVGLQVLDDAGDALEGVPVWFEVADPGVVALSGFDDGCEDSGGDGLIFTCTRPLELLGVQVIAAAIQLRTVGVGTTRIYMGPATRAEAEADDGPQLIGSVDVEVAP